jgi:hypothetical protein
MYSSLLVSRWRNAHFASSLCCLDLWSLEFDQQVSNQELSLELLVNYQDVCICLADLSHRIGPLRGEDQCFPAH